MLIEMNPSTAVEEDVDEDELVMRMKEYN